MATAWMVHRLLAILPVRICAGADDKGTWSCGDIVGVNFTQTLGRRSCLEILSGRGSLQNARFEPQDVAYSGHLRCACWAPNGIASDGSALRRPEIRIG